MQENIALHKVNGDTAYRTVSTMEVTMVGMKIFIVAQRYYFLANPVS